MISLSLIIYAQPKLICSIGNGPIKNAPKFSLSLALLCDAMVRLENQANLRASRTSDVSVAANSHKANQAQEEKETHLD